MIKSKLEITDYLKTKKREYVHKYGIKSLILFGSFSIDKQKPESDIDLIYKLLPGRKLGFRKYFELLYQLEEEFGRKVDLIKFENMNPVIKYYSKNNFIEV